MKNPLIEKLILKKFAGELAEHEEQELNNLLQNTGNRALYKEIEDIWENAAAAVSNLDYAIDSEWQKLEPITFNQTKKAKPATTVYNFIRELLASSFNIKRPALIGATVILLIMAALVFRRFSPSGAEYQEIITENGERVHHTFSDGSVADLNSGSQISFYENFTDSTRQITLRGEAFFQVAKEKRPFIVLARNARAQVLGTKFNIWTRDSLTRVFVAEGKVLFSAITSDSAFAILTANQASTITANGFPRQIATPDAEQALAWLDGKLAFEKTPLIEIIGELERHYNIVVELADDSLAGRTITGTFDKMSIGEVISSICLTLDLKYKKVNGTYLLGDF